MAHLLSVQELLSAPLLLSLTLLIDVEPANPVYRGIARLQHRRGIHSWGMDRPADSIVAKAPEIKLLIQDCSYSFKLAFELRFEV